jgi:hypothetical protein
MKEMERYTTINQKLSGLYLHLLLFVVVNFGLFLLNLLVYPFTIWFYFPLLMWSTAVLIHFFAVFVRHEDEWNERALMEIMKSGSF